MPTGRPASQSASQPGGRQRGPAERTRIPHRRVEKQGRLRPRSTRIRAYTHTRRERECTDGCCWLRARPAPPPSVSQSAWPGPAVCVYTTPDSPSCSLLNNEDEKKPFIGAKSAPFKGSSHCVLVYSKHIRICFFGDSRSVIVSDFWTPRELMSSSKPHRSADLGVFPHDVREAY